MSKITREELDEILKKHYQCRNGFEVLKKLNLSYEDLSYLNLCGVDLRGADLSGADLSNANLSNADLSNVDLTDTCLRFANLSGADLSGADLSNADLSFVNLRYANLSGAKGVKSNIEFLAERFEKTEEGYIVYKTFGGTFTPPANWNIEKGSVLSENVNFDRTCHGGFGINVAPIGWVKTHYRGTIWKCLIRWEWLAGVCCPYESSGIIRCERIELIEPVEAERECVEQIYI